MELAYITQEAWDLAAASDALDELLAEAASQGAE